MSKTQGLAPNASEEEISQFLRERNISTETLKAKEKEALREKVLEMAQEKDKDQKPKYTIAEVVAEVEGLLNPANAESTNLQLVRTIITEQRKELKEAGEDPSRFALKRTPATSISVSKERVVAWFENSDNVALLSSAQAQEIIDSCAERIEG